MNFGLQVSQLSVGELRPTGATPWDTQLIFTVGELRPTGITTHCRWTWAYRTSRANRKAADEHTIEYHATRLNSLSLYSSPLFSLLYYSFLIIIIHYHSHYSSSLSHSYAVLLSFSVQSYYTNFTSFNFTISCLKPFLFIILLFSLCLFTLLWLLFSLYLFTFLWLLCSLCFLYSALISLFNVCI